MTDSFYDLIFTTIIKQESLSHKSPFQEVEIFDKWQLKNISITWMILAFNLSNLNIHYLYVWK